MELQNYAMLEKRLNRVVKNCQYQQERLRELKHRLKKQRLETKSRRRTTWSGMTLHVTVRPLKAGFQADKQIELE